VRLDGNDPAAVEQAATLLAAGELVAFPTETVYGLGARADDDDAVARIFHTKGRPAGHPLIVHVADAADAQHFAARIPPVARRLMDAFWPGPLTVIVPRAAGVAGAAAGGQGSVGLRSPAHPVAQALLAAARRLGVAGVAGPSANRFGRVSPTHAAHVEAEFGSALALLDGGPCAVGIESSIVDCSRDRPVLLRPGMLTRARIEAVVGEDLHEPDVDAPRASGTLEAHYAPNAQVRLLSEPMLRSALHRRGDQAPELAVYSFGAPSQDATRVRYRRMPAQPALVARELFSVLREFDDEGVQLIWIEEPPQNPEWDGVRDRLRRAAASSSQPQ
jgi:L-threonylcarbamoyladenylate synthase